MVSSGFYLLWAFFDYGTHLCLSKIRTVFKTLNPTAMHLSQPFDSCIIQEFKDEWRSRWEEYKHECTRSNK